MKKIFLCLSLLCLILALAGCGSSPNSATPTTIKVEDSNHRIVTLKGKPQRIVTLSPSFIAPIQALDGKLIGTASSKLVPEAPALEQIGFIFAINTEKVLALQPDLVIGYQGMHERYLPLLEKQMGIPVLILKLKTYEDVQNCLTTLGQALQEEEKATQIKQQLEQSIQDTIAKNKQHHARIAIVHYSAQGIALETERSIAGNTAKMLKLHNVLNDAPQLKDVQKSGEFIPYNMEMLIQQNPEVVFVTSMGAEDGAKDYIKDQIMQSPSWSTVEAVRKGQVYYLPEQLFLVNPGLRYPQAVEFMANKIANLPKEADSK